MVTFSTQTNWLQYFAAVADIKLPPKMKKRGRPKGSENTVIGLKRMKSAVKVKHRH